MERTLLSAAFDVVVDLGLEAEVSLPILWTQSATYSDSATSAIKSFSLPVLKSGPDVGLRAPWKRASIRGVMLLVLVVAFVVGRCSRVS